MTTDRCADVADLAPGFVLGALTADEDRIVREHLGSCPEPHPEFAEVGGVVGYLGEAVELVEPPASLKDRIMAAAAADLAAGRVRATPKPGTEPELAAATTATPFPSTADRSERAERAGRRTSPLQWVAGLAAVIAIVA